MILRETFLADRGWRGASGPGFSCPSSEPLCGAALGEVRAKWSGLGGFVPFHVKVQRAAWANGEFLLKQILACPGMWDHT